MKSSICKSPLIGQLARSARSFTDPPRVLRNNNNKAARASSWSRMETMKQQTNTNAKTLSIRCVNNRRIQTTTTTTTYKPNTSQWVGLSFSTEINQQNGKELLEQALTYACQDDPYHANQIFDMVEKEKGSDEYARVATSVIDAWITYQNQLISELMECSNKNETGKDENKISKEERLEKLKEICHAADSIVKIVDESIATSTTNRSHHHHHDVVAALRSLANVTEVGRTIGLFKSSILRGIPQRMQHLLEAQDKPTTESYNQILKAWTYSGEHLRGTMAEQVFQQIAEPNSESYRLIIRAWTWSKERRSAYTATGHYIQMMKLLGQGQLDTGPTMEDYHELFHAWTRAEDKNAPSKVQTVIQIMEAAYKNETTTLRPDEVCYRAALVTASRRLNVPEVGEVVDTTLTFMKQRLMVPDSTCFGAAILAWKNAAFCRECEDREGSIRRTVELLEELNQAYHRTTQVLVRPSTKDFNHVLEALTMSKSPRAANEAERLLSDMEQAVTTTTSDDEAGDDCIGGLGFAPNAITYRLVLDVLRNCRSTDKLERAKLVLDRFKDEFRTNKERLLQGTKADDTTAPITDVFCSFIAVCANANTRDESERMDIFKTALQSLDDMMTLGLNPSARTFKVLLEASQKLLSEGRDRQVFMERIFVRCCEEGYVDQSVLMQLQSSVDTHLYSKLVVRPSRVVEDTKVVPESWTRNIKDFMVNAKGGRKVLPLSIEGKFTSTKALSEYKMRKLRRRLNQKALQGGRMK